MYIQSSLFAESALEIVRDGEGGIVYHPACVATDRAARWFAELMAVIPWRSLRRPMYDRVVDVPRLVASIVLHDPTRPACIDRALAVLHGVAPAPYNRVGLNLYRDGRDSVAPHGDRDADLVPGWPIAILSLGAARDMVIRARGSTHSQRITLQPGSVLVMSHACQSTHEHAIPKCRDGCGPRISLAFRVRRRLLEGDCIKP